MGIGDELMAAGEARHLHKKTGRKVIISDRYNRPRWSEIWEGSPYIAHGNVYGADRIVNGSGARPYIAGKTMRQWVWKPYRPIPAEIFFTPAELKFAAPYRGMVMIEPNVKAIGHDNKAWIAMRWGEVAIRIGAVGHGILQCSAPGDQGRLLAATHVPTPTFRHAAAVLSVCKAFVGTEGGLMHAAAAVGTPAVILWSEFISPSNTGYPTMANLRHAGAACGNRFSCPGCRKSMEAITVDEVVKALEEILK